MKLGTPAELTYLSNSFASAAALVPGNSSITSCKRRTAASGMTRIGIPASAADVVLGHKLKGSAAAYLHGARLVEAASALWRWSDHLERLLREPADRKGGDVLPMRGRA